MINVLNFLKLAMSHCREIGKFIQPPRNKEGKGGVRIVFLVGSIDAWLQTSDKSNFLIRDAWILKSTLIFGIFNLE